MKYISEADRRAKQMASVFGIEETVSFLPLRMYIIGQTQTKTYAKSLVAHPHPNFSSVSPAKNRQI